MRTGNTNLMESRLQSTQHLADGNECALPEEAAARGQTQRFGWLASTLAGLARRVFSYPAALAAGLVAVTVLSLATRFENPDLWWHLKVGQIIWNTHTIPSSDLFSFTAQGHPWTAHEWLSEVSMYGAYKLGGYTGLMIWVSVLASLIFLVVYLLCWLMTGNALVALRGGMVAWCFGTVGLSIRPLILGHLFLAAEILVLELARTRRRRWLWLLPPLFAAWVNCHPSFVFGMAVLAVYFISSLIKASAGLVVSEDSDRGWQLWLGWILVACTAALCANPIGIRLWIYPFDVLFHQRTSLESIQEWLPPDLRQGRTLAMLAVVPAVLLLSMIRKSSLSIRELLLMLMASGLALQHSRMVFLFGILISPILCRFGWGRDNKRTYPLANAVIMGGCLAAVIWFFSGPAALEKQVLQVNPVQAVKFIRASHLAGPMLNEYRFGGYLIWNLPETKVFIDGRGDVYDWNGTMGEYLRWANLREDPKLMLDRHGIKFCLLYDGSSIARAMPYLPGWKKIYSDGLAVVFSR